MNLFIRINSITHILKKFKINRGGEYLWRNVRQTSLLVQIERSNMKKVIKSNGCYCLIENQVAANGIDRHCGISR